MLKVAVPNQINAHRLNSLRRIHCGRWPGAYSRGGGRRSVGPVSVFDEFKEMLQSFNETATQSEAVVSLEDHIKNVRTGSGDVITLALREAKTAFEHAAEMCQKVLDSYSRND